MSLLLLAAGSACGGASEDTRPSVLLVVIDTLRADAVSAYGKVDGTTPNLDALAREGLLYTRAYAPSPWTAPSHATLLTGLRISQHRVGIGGHMSLPERIDTVAERLRAAGYQTAGFSENLLVSDGFRMSQGFEHFEATTPQQVLLEVGGNSRLGILKGVAKVAWQGLRRAVVGPDGRMAALADALAWGANGLQAALWPGGNQFDALASLEDWAQKRDAKRPFFVFVNLMDAHEPYAVREDNPFLRSDGMRAIQRNPELVSPHSSLCDRVPSDRAIEALHGLYLGDVAEADAKLGAIRRLLADAEDLVTVVTSDHGEHFGERRLMNHLFSVDEAVLRVPLVVHGAPGLQAGLQHSAVELADLAPTLLGWAGIQPTDELPGHPLPSTPAASAPTRALLAVYDDAVLQSPSQLRDAWELGDADRLGRRAGCGTNDRVFGPMAALTRYPFKLIWYERYSPQLFDLSQDPEQTRDLHGDHSEIARPLEQEMQSLVDAVGFGDTAQPAELPTDAAEALRGLGYVD